MNIEMPMFGDIKRIHMQDRFSFVCGNCGLCCDVQGSHMRMPWDIYNMAKHLKRPVEATFSQCFVEHREEGVALPYVSQRTHPGSLECIFRNNGKCSNYEARPDICRIYPVVIDPMSMEFYLDASVPQHGLGQEYTTEEWLGDWYCAKQRKLYEAFSSFLIEFQHKASQGSVSTRKTARTFRRLYLAYDIQKPFAPQFYKNLRELGE